jgi:hypothetical protein
MTSDEASVRVRFEFSAADMADVARRSADRSKTIRDSRWQAAASWSALLGLALFFALNGSFIARATFSVAFCLGLFFLFSRRTWSSPNTTYLKYSREQLGGDGPFLCEVEMTPAGLTTRQGGIETKRPWSVVEEIIDTSDGFEFRFRIGGILVVRDRAFDTAELRSIFLRRAKEFLASSAEGSPDQQRTA